MSRWMNMTEAEKRADEAAWCAAQPSSADEPPPPPEPPKPASQRPARCRRCGQGLVCLAPLPPGVPDLCGDCERFIKAEEKAHRELKGVS